MLSQKYSIHIFRPRIYILQMQNICFIIKQHITFERIPYVFHFLSCMQKPYMYHQAITCSYKIHNTQFIDGGCHIMIIIIFPSHAPLYLGHYLAYIFDHKIHLFITLSPPSQLTAISMNHYFITLGLQEFHIPQSL